MIFARSTGGHRADKKQLQVRTPEEQKNQPCKQPTSHLPAELWSAIINFLIASSHTKTCNLYPESCSLSQNLSLRLVSRIFASETVTALHRHLTQPHIPPQSFRIHNPPYDTHLRNTLLASALYNSYTIPTAAQDGLLGFNKPHAALFMQRIANCIDVASHIDHEFTSFHAAHLARVFCDAASTSHYCWSYFFVLTTTRGHGGLTLHAMRAFTEMRRDWELEFALLVACGYLADDVGTWICRLGKNGVGVDGKRGAWVYHGEERQRRFERWGDVLTMSVRAV